MTMNKVKILGQTYKIKYQNLEAASEMGVCFPMRNKIIIDKRSLPGYRDSTILHEIIEAINSRLELGLEHEQITALEEVLHMVLKDNDGWWRKSK